VARRRRRQRRGSLSLREQQRHDRLERSARRLAVTVGCGRSRRELLHAIAERSERASMPACAGCRRGSAPRPRRSGARDADRSDRAAAEHREAAIDALPASAEELRGALLTARPAPSAPPRRGAAPAAARR